MVSIKIFRLILLLTFSGAVYAENFDARILFAKAAMQSEEGKEYEVLVRESTWDADSECFRESAEV
ncbi:hypothetical protein [Microbulbifer sp. GL-2]|uniref:hypothetical protein n=1 Tax=Microbulbifer sp. GL-2 TaxID=2591606 RepID=UPI00116319FA|nr:hypothetical protein [Microbulbifer sp. GL-2]BBM00243.1 hypothetical protein GL2_03170 [Microbulbifer sp. GL-2]